ncbi:hypothetical protein [Halosimplex sp. J119]
MAPQRRDVLKAGGIAALGALGGAHVADVPVNVARAQSDASTEYPEIRLAVHQDSGQAVNWVLPAKRRIDEFVFGTPDEPINTGQHWVNVAEGPVADLLRDQTYQVGLPLEQRETTEDDSAYTVTTFDSFASPSRQEVSGELDLTYVDRRPWDRPGAGTDTPDTVELTATFSDPADNEYRLEVDQVFQPPIPSWQTGGGVVTNSWLHGVTGTGSPLLPTAFTYGAFWGLGNVVVNGEVRNRRQVIHFMTTQMIRKSDYSLATDPELPLSPDEAYLGNLHQTHAVVAPIRVTEDGPVPAPVETAFELPNGNTQPFVHVMWDEETIDGYTVVESEGGEGTATPGTATGTSDEGTATATDAATEPSATDTGTGTETDG